MSARRHDVRIPAPEGAGRVELYGELADWITPVPFLEGEARLSLPDGVYSYKLRVDGEWSLDPNNPRTRAAGDHRNSVISLGGAPEPILFAPALPWIGADPRGGVTVTAALRAGSGDRLWIRWSEAGERERRAEMTRALDEIEHTLFRAWLPISSGTASFRFELEGGLSIGPEEDPESAFTWSDPGAAIPAWWERAVVYTIFVDRFRAEHDDAAWGLDPGPRRAAGGHLEGVRRSLDHLQRLGVDTLYLTPIHVAASCHRYDVVDPLRVDPALGGDEALDRLIADLHARGMRLVLDFTFSHAGRGFPAYDEVTALGRAAPRADWFRWSGDPPALVHYFGSDGDTPLFNLDHPEVRDLVLRTAELWASRGVDGLRLDAAAEFPIDLARAVRDRLRSIRPDAVLVAELVPRHAFRWRVERAIDAAIDFGFFDLATELLAEGGADAAEARRRLLELDLTRGVEGAASMRLLSTHDRPRFATRARLAGRTPGAIDLGLVLLFTAPGVPALLYGEELGLAADGIDERDEVWPDRLPMRWDEAAHGGPTIDRVRALADLRRASPALIRGTFEIAHGEGDLLVYRREAGGEVIDVALNAGDDTIAFDLEDEALPVLTPIFSRGDVAFDGEAVALGPRSATLIRRSARPLGAGGRRLQIARNLAARDADLRTGAPDTAARPSRIDFAITERCNLRCRHCITAAPERTASGAARTLPLRLVDRLREDLAFAEYVGFVHGGEPLVAPVLFDVLAALASARAGERTAVHLLTNGVLLGDRMIRRLVAAGVTSISVSLDGAAAATNDAIRAGGRFDHVIDNLRAAAHFRREAGVDLRLGISAVVLRDNVAELSALVELAADLGLDWIKLEELVPVNAFAERSLIRLDAGPVRAAVAAALDRARALGLVAVDHTDAPVVWRCRLDAEPETRRFLEADEYANQSVIHPCRTAWEHACVAPSGDVYLGEFFGPVIGNLAEEPLTSMWNGPVARSERRRAVRARLCGAGPVTCLGEV